MNPILSLYVPAQTFVQDRVEDAREFVHDRAVALRGGEDRGASAIEYAGLVLIAGVIIVFLVTAANDTIKPKVEEAINNIFNGGGGGGEKK